MSSFHLKSEKIGSKEQTSETTSETLQTTILPFWEVLEQEIQAVVVAEWLRRLTRNQISSEAEVRVLSTTHTKFRFALSIYG